MKISRRRVWIGAAVAVAALVVLRITLPAAIRVRPMPGAPPAAHDANADPLPPFALARIGSIRFRGVGHGLGWTDGGTALVSCGSDGVVRVIDGATGLVRREFVAHRGVVEPGGPAQSMVESVQHVVNGSMFTSVHDVPLDAAVSADGSRIVTGGPAAVSVWDVATGARVSTWRGSRRSASVLAISGDGRLVAQAGSDGRLDVRDAATGRRVARLKQPMQGSERIPVHSVALSGDGAVAAFTVNSAESEKDSLHLVEVATGREIGAAGVGLEGGAVAVSPRGDLVATSPRNNTIVDGAPDHAWVDGWLVTPLVIRDGAEFKERVTTKPFLTDPWAGLAFRPDGGMVACGGRALTLVDAKTGEVVRTITVETETQRVHAIVWSPDGRRVAALWDAAIRIWDAETGAEETRISARETCLSMDGGTIAVSRAASTIDLFDARSGAFLRAVGAGDPKQHLFQASIRDGVVAAWSAEKGLVLRRWRVANGEPMESRTIDRWSYSGGDTPTIRRQTADGAVELLDPVSGDPAAAFPAPGDPFLGLTPDRRFVVGAGGALTVWERTGGRLELRWALAQPRWGSGPANSFSADSRAMAFAEGNRVHVLEVATGEKIGEFRAPENDYANPIALSPDARIAATSGADGAIVLHDVATGDLLATLPGHRARVSRIIFSADGRTLVTAADTILVWDVTPWTGR